jgi:hypothetical protein
MREGDQRRPTVIDYRRDVRRYANLKETAQQLAPDLSICDSCMRRSADINVEGFAELCWICNDALIASVGKDY